MKKRIWGWFVVMVLVVQTATITNVNAQEEKPDIFGGYGVAIDAKTGDILYEKKAKEAASPASMTKVLTALLIAENMEDDELIPVTEQSIATECSCYGVETEELLSKQDAIHALMIQSANDVAVAAAEHIGGSVEGFADMMNERAKEIGVSDETNFVTPNGLDAPEHHVAAYDMALIVREAIRNEEVLAAMQAKSYTAQTNKKTVELNRHDNIHGQESAVGGKTGYTSKSGNTLAVYFKDGEKEIVTVVMQSNKANHYSDSTKMFQYAKEQLTTQTVYAKNAEVDEIEVEGKKVQLRAREDFVVTHKKDEEPSYRVETVLIEEKDVVKAGEVIGTGKVYDGDKLVGEVSLISDSDVQMKVVEQETEATDGLVKISIWWALILPWFFYAVGLIWYNFQKRKKIKAKN